MTSDASQRSLSEELWLLKKLRLRFSEKIDLHGHKHTTTLKVLDTVALFLSTDQPDGVFATFYLHKSSTLYIVKSGVVTPEDTHAVDRFIKALDTARTYEDLLPFLTQRGAAKVNKRICKLHKTLESIFPTTEDLRERAIRYKPGPDPTAEFNQCWLKLFMGSRVSESTAQTLQMIVEECKRYSDMLFDESAEACHNFCILMTAARALIGSRCFIMFWAQGGPVQKFARHLDKISMYLNVELVLKFWRRDGLKINIQWVPDGGPVVPPVVLNTALRADRCLDATLERFQGSADQKAKFRDCVVERMNKIFPHWWGDEGSPPIPVAPVVHVEIRMILHLMASVDTEGQEPLIGCSQMSCLYCKFWMDAFDHANKIYWKTRLSTNAPRYDWTFPDHPSVRLEATLDFVMVKTWIMMDQVAWEAWEAI